MVRPLFGGDSSTKLDPSAPSPPRIPNIPEETKFPLGRRSRPSWLQKTYNNAEPQRRRNHVPVYDKKPPLEFLEAEKMPGAAQKSTADATAMDEGAASPAAEPAAPAALSHGDISPGDISPGELSLPLDAKSHLSEMEMGLVVLAFLMGIACSVFLFLRLRRTFWRRAGRPQVPPPHPPPLPLISPLLLLPSLPSPPRLHRPILTLPQVVSKRANDARRQAAQGAGAEGANDEGGGAGASAGGKGGMHPSNASLMSAGFSSASIDVIDVVE